MQFLVIGRDGSDPNAMMRRRAARNEHLAQGDRMVAAGTLLCGAALLNDEGEMVGSMYLVEFPSRAELEAWLRIEPYVLGGVWQDVQVEPARLGPSFAHLVDSASADTTA